MITMKKISGLLAATLLLSAGTAFGQDGSTDNGGIAANASVLSAIDVTAGVSLEFGKVSPNITKSVNTAGAVSGGAATGGEQAGTFTVAKGANSHITLSWTLPDSLFRASSPTLDGLRINFADLAGGTVKLGELSTGSTPASPYAFEPGVTSLNLQTNGAPITGDDNYFAASQINVKIGGTVVPKATQTSGDYTGTITLTATYN